MKRFAILLAVMVLGLAACQSAGEVATEQVLENIDGVDDVKIDGDTGEFSIETEDGSFTFGNTDVPESLNVEIPDGGTVMASIELDDAVTVSLEYPLDDFDDLVEFYEEWTSSNGGEWQHHSGTFESAEGVDVRNESWSDGDTLIGLASCPSAEATDAQIRATCLTISQNG